MFAALAAFNEHFAKLQDAVDAAMRHGALLMSDANSLCLKVRVLFEKLVFIAVACSSPGYLSAAMNKSTKR